MHEVKNTYPFVHRVEMAQKKCAFSMTSATHREVPAARLRLICDTPGAACRPAILPGTLLTGYRRRDCGICKLGLTPKEVELNSTFSGTGGAMPPGPQS